jgi:histidinol-phosphate aminotransferase
MVKYRSEILAVPPAHHGAFDYAELERLGLDPDTVLDFSVNSNPYGSPPGVPEAIVQVALELYPDRECIALRRKLSQRHHLEMEHIVVGNGTAELLLLLALALIQPGDRVLVIAPTFLEYARTARLMGAEVHYFTTEATTDFQIEDYDKLADCIEQVQPKLVFSCQPNNPTGNLLDVAQVAGLMDSFPDTVFVFDEAYLDFITPEQARPSLTSWVRERANLLILHSMTKNYALAGLRLGYVVGDAALVQAISQVRPAWNVNGLALAAGLVVLEADEWLKDTLGQLHETRQDLVIGLEKVGLPVVPSAVHYFIVKVGQATAFRSQLLEHNIMVRDCTSFGLPEYVRIATRLPNENTQLLKAIGKVKE